MCGQLWIVIWASIADLKFLFVYMIVAYGYNFAFALVNLFPSLFDELLWTFFLGEILLVGLMEQFLKGLLLSFRIDFWDNFWKCFLFINISRSAFWMMYRVAPFLEPCRIVFKLRMKTSGYWTLSVFFVCSDCLFFDDQVWEWWVIGKGASVLNSNFQELDFTLL